MYNVKQKFCAINDHLEHTQKLFDDSKKAIGAKTLRKSFPEHSDNENDLPGYLHKEILGKPMKRNRKIHRIDEISISGRVEKGSEGGVMFNDGKIQF